MDNEMAGALRTIAKHVMDQTGRVPHALVIIPIRSEESGIWTEGTLTFAPGLSAGERDTLGEAIDLALSLPDMRRFDPSECHEA